MAVVGDLVAGAFRRLRCLRRLRGAVVPQEVHLPIGHAGTITTLLIFNYK